MTDMISTVSGRGRLCWFFVRFVLSFSAFTFLQIASSAEETERGQVKPEQVEPVHAELQGALEAYDAGEFEQAFTGFIATLEGLEREGKLGENTFFGGMFGPGALLYNTGNAAYKAGQLGEAVAAYLAARSLQPDQPDVVANLAFVQAQSKDKLEAKLPASPWFTLLALRALLSQPQWLALASSLLLLALVAFLVRSVFPVLEGRDLSWLVKLTRHVAQSKLRLGLLRLGMSLSCVGLCCLALVYAKGLDNHKWGAVTAPQAVAYSGPGQQHVVVFRVHEGAPVAVEGQRPGWWQVRLSDGKRGWLPVEAVRVWFVAADEQG